jgi:hypothetical protein
MKKLLSSSVFILFFTFVLGNSSQAQSSLILDDFSKKALPDWIWGGVDMKYSHSEDNKENGYAEIYTTDIVKPNSYIGKIEKQKKFLFTAGNFVNLMLKGVENNCLVKVSIIYDVDNDNAYEEDVDIMLMAKPISLNFKGWKEVKFKLDEESFNLISKHKDDFTVTEEPAMSIRIEFESGPDFTPAKFESGIALVSEITNTENLTLSETSSNKNPEETYFKAKNYPNPFNPSTTISFILPTSDNVSVTVYDRIGREVNVLMDQTLGAGEHTIEFSASGLPSGIYFYRIKTSDRTEVFKMMLAK